MFMFIVFNTFLQSVNLALQSSDNQTRTVSLLEPGWVTALRNNIKNVIQYKGYYKAKENIRDMIQEANEEINGEESQRQRAIARMKSYVDTGEKDEDAEAKAMMEPRWEKDLKMRIKTIIKQYGKSSLDDFVRPVIAAIERNNEIKIRYIDGEVSIIWTYAGVPPGLTSY